MNVGHLSMKKTSLYWQIESNLVRGISTVQDKWKLI